jgi:3-deoxy-D-manno-octulosonic-acid transferase
MNFIYSYLILPALFIIANVVTLFSKKLRDPIFQRNKILIKIKNLKTTKKSILIHAASMGEFEHIRPVINKIKTDLDVNLFVTFFSPSGYENVKSFPGVKQFFYLPYDFGWLWNKFYKAINCDVLLISKHDVWPNQMRIAKKRGIKTALINASLSASSSRQSFLAKLILGKAYRSFDKIFTIGAEDDNRFKKTFSCTNTEICGDTKFDQVLIRKENSENLELLDPGWRKEKQVLVFGSLWPQDAEHVLKNLSQLLQNNPDLKVIIIPHQPTKEIIRKLLVFSDEVEYDFYSEKINPAGRVLVIDKIGLLADMYKYADIAYVGGSFQQGIHNVLEPAIYKVPVIYGPVYKNSFEAIGLNKAEGALVVHDASGFYEAVQKLLQNKKYCESVGEKAEQFALKNSGSTKRILNYIDSTLKKTKTTSD